MTSIINWLNHKRDLMIEDNVYNAEINSWFLMNSVWPVTIIIGVYLLFVLKIGPQIMRKRKPFQLRGVLLVYNSATLIFSVYSFVTLFESISLMKSYCHSQQLKDDELILPVTQYRIIWFFFISKIVELLDTILFVLRKKQSQVTVLHVYHHSSIIFNVWLYLKYVKDVQGFFVSAANSFVHIFMYLYYFLAAFGPKMQKYLWWKKYITILQLAQFVFVVLMYAIASATVDCQIHRGSSSYFTVYAISFLLLFLNFYTKEYFQRKNENSSRQIKVKI